LRIRPWQFLDESHVATAHFLEYRSQFHGSASRSIL
jgi:hypothetical protein